MKIKLIDVQTEIEDDVEFGTCELCMFTSSAEYPTFIFEKEDGTQFEVMGWGWNWGELDTLYIDNVVLFNDYISKIEFDEDTEFDYLWLNNLSFDYGEVQDGRAGSL